MPKWSWNWGPTTTNESAQPAMLEYRGPGAQVHSTALVQYAPAPTSYEDVLAREAAFPLTMICGRTASSVQAKPSMKFTDVWEQCRAFFGNYLELEICITGGRLLNPQKTVSWNRLSAGNAILIYRETDDTMLAVVQAVLGRVVRLRTFEGVQLVALTRERDQQVIGNTVRVTRGQPLEVIGMMNVAQLQAFLRRYI